MKPIRKVSASKYQGMGDVVERVAKPVAKFIDHIANTDLEHCSGCAARRASLNRIFPFAFTPDNTPT